MDATKHAWLDILAETFGDGAKIRLDADVGGGAILTVETVFDGAPCKYLRAARWSKLDEAAQWIIDQWQAKTAKPAPSDNPEPADDGGAEYGVGWNESRWLLRRATTSDEVEAIERLTAYTGRQADIHTAAGLYRRSGQPKRAEQFLAFHRPQADWANGERLGP